MTHQSVGELTIEFTEDLEPEPELQLLKGINDFGIEQKKMPPIELFGVFIKDAKGTQLGGLSGWFYYGCMHIDMFWLNPSCRHAGWGVKLMNEAEKRARTRGCTFSTVETMDWEAPPFYEKLGYFVEFIRKGYHNNSTMYLMRKNFHPMADLMG
jgi:ribosomal protein S18 acetylase RimI-like enzyme